MANSARPASERLFAAGSLREAFVLLIAAYKERTGVQFAPLFGPSGKLREQIQPQLTWVRIPEALNVGAVYGIGASTTASTDGKGFVQFALGDQGRAILARFGFDGP
jgi:ABC-type molybdate transport system substrate-binding protein